MKSIRPSIGPLLKADALQLAIHNSANFSSIATDAQGVIQIFNVGAERMLGYSAAEVVNRITPAGFSDAQEIIARAAALSVEAGVTILPGFEALVFKASRGIEDIYELTYIRKDGSRIPAIVSVSPLRDAEEKVIGYLLMGTDNTARKRVEQEQALLDQRLREQQLALQDTNVELEAARALAETANRAKSEFLSAMSHELRTPLNAVLGFAQLLASDKPPPSASQQRSLDQILKGGWYLLQLINEILDLAMIESGKVTMSQESMGLSEVLRDCQALIGPQAEQRGIRLFFAAMSEPFFVHADRTRVKQVMINLLSNAIKYNRRGGQVTVECQAGSDGMVRISVTDTGAGLSSTQMAQLFQPFNRLGQEDGAEEGTGIGLVVTKQLTELMGGSIGVRSEIGVGTTFWIELAASNEPVLEIAAFDLAAPVPGKDYASLRTLLYIEDNPANLSLVEQLIQRRSDLKLLTAIDGHSGIQLARAYQPDVILMDINLPGVSGYGCLKILQDDAATAHIPVVALSANAMPRDIEKGVEAGFFRYLTKPINVHEFMGALDLALEFAAGHGSLYTRTHGSAS
ncbi:hybrid sensor histidine kinase/response regulator [Duganella violaceipulchra]|uniref:histidine kinase n=1 Tax=Duganella violaceipulchra TaxID=2849652 RepID=A0AA41L2T7_9BURK|nr:ATP-binding protein [Duganella violaceicalia]MBV6322978.1 response regulator [Duganella violaceicalia]MCP2008061.1 signal transduction histidine kinase/ActR/RegA family two-component response regulator [Duganella violaceicalia]